MAVTITDLRGTPFNECDATTGWTGAVSVFTSQPTPAESTGCLGVMVSTTTANIYVTATGRDLSDSIISLWVRAYGAMDTYANGGIGIVVGDGTNRMAYYVGGSDKAAFRHNDGPVEWTCFILDTTSLPTGKATIAGSEGSMNWSSITDIGVRFKTLAKAVGGIENCWVDIIRTGVEGIKVTGGGSGTEGTFTQIAAADRVQTDKGALGICRLLATGAVGLQGPITFGDTGSASVDFEAVGETVVFEPPAAGVADDRFWLAVVGGTGTTSVVWVGCSFVCPAGVGAGLLAAESDADVFTMDGCLIKGYEQGITFLSTTTSGVFTIIGNTFSGCGQLNLGYLLQDGTFTGNTITGSTDAATGALLLGATGYTSGLTLEDTTFVSGGSGHAIYITQAGTYTFDGVVCSGYGADASADAAIYNNSGGAVTINAQGGSSGLTVLNGSGASTTINNSVAVKVTAKTRTGTAVADARVYLATDPGGTVIFDGSDGTSLTDSNGEVETTWNYTADVDVVGRVRKSSSSPYYKTGDIVATIGATGLDATVIMILDE